MYSNRPGCAASGFWPSRAADRPVLPRSRSLGGTPRPRSPTPRPRSPSAPFGAGLRHPPSSRGGRCAACRSNQQPTGADGGHPTDRAHAWGAPLQALESGLGLAQKMGLQRGHFGVWGIPKAVPPCSRLHLPNTDAFTIQYDFSALPAGVRPECRDFGHIESVAIPNTSPAFPNETVRACF